MRGKYKTVATQLLSPFTFKTLVRKLSLFTHGNSEAWESKGTSPGNADITSW